MPDYICFMCQSFQVSFLYVQPFLGCCKKLQYKTSDCQKSHIFKMEARCTRISEKDPLKLQQT